MQKHTQIVHVPSSQLPTARQVMAPLRLSASGTKCTTPDTLDTSRLLWFVSGMNEIFLQWYVGAMTI